MTCICCGSDRAYWESYSGPTGVTAPDGGREMREEAGWRCLDCGGIDDQCQEDVDEAAQRS